MVIQGVSYPSDFEAKKQMIEAGKRLDQKGYVIAGEGSLSVRVGPNAVWITAEGAWKGELKQESFIRVDLNGKQTPGSRQNRLPEDLALHLQVYEQNPALRCIVHAYPPEGVVLAENGTGLPAADLTPAIRALGEIPVTSQSGEEAARQAALVCRTQNGILVKRDGCVMWGESLREALCRIETLEYYGKVQSLMKKSQAGCGGCQQNGCCQCCSQEGAYRMSGQNAFGMAGTSAMGATGRTALESAGANAFGTTGIGASAFAPASASAIGTTEPEASGFAGPIEGLTGIIRPGMPFPKAEESGQTLPAQPVVQTKTPAGVAITQTAAGDRRRSMMDEVVRQSLMRLKP